MFRPPRRRRAGAFLIALAVAGCSGGTTPTVGPGSVAPAGSAGTTASRRHPRHRLPP